MLKEFLLCVSLFTASSLLAQDSLNFPSIGSIERLDPRIDALLPKDAKIEVVTSGFTWCEGPAWHKEGGFLVFSEIPSNTVKKWVEGEGVSDYLRPSGYTGVADYGNEPGSNGLAFDKEGRLISCEHGDRRVSIMTHGGGKRTLVDNYKGRRLNSPNDLALASNGDVYFTDPPYGLPIPKKDPLRREYFKIGDDGNRIVWDDPRADLDFCGVYLLRKSGELVLLTDELVRPNGVALSPDEKMLYVAQSDPEQPIIKQYPIKKDGTLGKGRVLFNALPYRANAKGLPDGLKVDEKGNLWASAPHGIYVITPEGELLGRILTYEATSNCAWGDDGSTLYITADTYVVRVKTKVKGAAF